MDIFIGLCIIVFAKGGTCENTDENESLQSEKPKDTTEPTPDEKWVSEAIKDIAYYLRSYKFNEWDRRYHQSKPAEYTNLIGYYGAFPEPALRSLHWKVYEHCVSNFYKCIRYLHGITESAPLTRRDDTSTILNENTLQMNDSQKYNLDIECKKGLESSEATGLPFDGPIEKFQWRTSAAYYMCWYTMLETPALSILEEQCDNFANCLDPDFGPHNRDPRSEDSVSFACATYSFCPDSCCPLKYVKDIMDCYHTEANPCFAENSAIPENQVCTINRNNNRNFRDIILNKWNVSCHCDEKGFHWESQYGMCVDVDECVTGEHTCDPNSEDCLNLPGSFTCVCRWEYNLDSSTNKCTHRPLLKFSKFDVKENLFSIVNVFNRLRKFVGL